MRAFTPAQKLSGRDYVVSIFEKLELASERFGRHQIAIQSRVNDFVFCGQYTVVSQDRGCGQRSAAKISCLGQAGIDNVLQQGTDQFHALATKSQLSGVPGSMSRDARLPTICGRCRECNP